MKRLPKTLTLQRVLPWLLIICGVIGLICAFIITVDKIHQLQNPHFAPGCDLNPIISCGSVMKSNQSNAFVFSYPFIGLAGFAVIITTGVVLLADAKLKRWYW